MENENDRYLEAARIVANCKPSKLPYVLAILREGGIEIEDDARLPSKENLRGASKRKKSLSASRCIKDPVDWQPTEDKTILALRKAFKDGMNISRFAEASDLPRTAIYKIMSAKTKITDYYRAKVENGLAILEEKK